MEVTWLVQKDSSRRGTEAFHSIARELFVPRGVVYTLRHAGKVCWLMCCVAASVVGDSTAFGLQPPNMVAGAIGKAAAYLVSLQGADGTWDDRTGHGLGQTALATLALLSAGWPADNRSIQAAAHAMRERAIGNSNTYDIALVIMALDRLGNPRDADLLRTLGTRLSTGQCAHGAWSYTVDRGCGGGDNSNTQFAALAAWVSRRHGVENDAAMRRLDSYFRTSFDNPGRGWGYTPGSPPTPTMTCAGLVGIAIQRGAQQQRDRDAPQGSPGGGRPTQGGPRQPAIADDPFAKRALEALGEELKMADRNGAAPLNGDLYFFWSLERVAVIYDVRRIGGIDWYEWGSRRLLHGQSPSGEWQGRSGTKGWPFDKAVGTSFGILFLCRANVAEDLTASVGEGGGGGVGKPLPGGGGGSQTFRRASDLDAAPASTDRPSSPPTGNSRRPPPAKPSPKPGTLNPF